jgi:hypothetical protein
VRSDNDRVFERRRARVGMEEEFELREPHFDAAIRERSRQPAPAFEIGADLRALRQDRFAIEFARERASSARSA